MNLNSVKIAFHTLGCKVNIYETEVMEAAVKAAGAEVVPFENVADIYIVNTCSVTNIADRKSRQMLRRAKKVNPDSIVVACGCYAQVEDAEKVKKDCGVDLVLGNEGKDRIDVILENYLMKGQEPAKGENTKKPVIAPMHLNGLSDHTRADVKVQDGCNQFCTYCIIPYARGRIRSRAVEDAVAEVEALAKNGIREIVLTGIHLDSYGQDQEPKTDLLTLIRAVHEVAGIERIRLGSLEPRVMTAEFVKALSELPKICPQFHLSLQSGCGKTLKRMNRKYTPEEYAKSCAYIRQYFTRPAITTDVIVGFPGETEEEAEESGRFVKNMAFYDLHVFKYSRRKGTPADKMPDQIDEQVKSERSDRLLALEKEMSRAFIESWAGHTVQVLTEQEVMTEQGPFYAGFTKEYIKVLVPGRTKGNELLSGILSLDGPGGMPVLRTFTELS